MATFIALLNLPDSHAAEPGSHAHKLEEGAPETRKVLEAHGGKLIDIYLTMGQFDGVAIMEFPTTVACAQAMMAFRERRASRSAAARRRWKPSPRANGRSWPKGSEAAFRPRSTVHDARSAR